MKKKVISVIGARPNFIKIAPLHNSLSKNFDHLIIHTGQHFDYEMSQTFFGELAIPKPDYNLKIGAQEPCMQIALVISKLEKLLSKLSPNIVLVYGDTNSSLAAAITASKIKIPVAHIEAGERSFDKKMTEEINRIIIDHISDLNLCATTTAVENLKRESVTNNVFWTGDVMFDLFKGSIKIIKTPNINLPKEYILLTLHRAENTEKGILIKILKSVEKIPHTVIWPIHPRSKKTIFKSKLKVPSNIQTTQPVSYLEMLHLEKNSKAILTDSGGVQKEAYWWGKPCITMLSSTAWKQTLKGGWNQEIGNNLNTIRKFLLKKPKAKRNVEFFGDGSAAPKTNQIILKYLKQLEN